jgi:RNA polymerase sigma-70 factor (ECF subfamily)
VSEWPKSVRARLQGRSGRPGTVVSHPGAGTAPGPEERTLLEGLRSHDPSALESLAQVYGALLFNVAVRITGSAADADDVVQETLLRAWNRSPSGPAHLRAWLVTVTTRLALNELRRRRRHPVAPSSTSSQQPGAAGGFPEARGEEHPSYDPYKAVAAHLSEAEAVRALLALPPTLRAAMVLRALHGLDYAEIADVLGCSVGAARVKVHRARRRCARALLGAEPILPEKPACATVRERIAEWADGELSPKDAAIVEAHVSSCRYCQQARKRAETARSAWGLLPLLAWGGGRRTAELAATTSSRLARFRHSARVRSALMGKRDRHVLMALTAIATAGAAVGGTVASVHHAAPVARLAPTAPTATPATTVVPATAPTSAPPTSSAPPGRAANPPGHLWPYTATAVTSQVPALVPGRAYGLVHLANNHNHGGHLLCCGLGRPARECQAVSLPLPGRPGNKRFFLRGRLFRPRRVTGQHVHLRHLGAGSGFASRGVPGPCHRLGHSGPWPEPRPCGAALRRAPRQGDPGRLLPGRLGARLPSERAELGTGPGEHLVASPPSRPAL